MEKLDSIVFVAVMIVVAVYLGVSAHKTDELDNVNPKDPDEGNGSPKC